MWRMSFAFSASLSEKSALRASGGTASTESVSRSAASGAVSTGLSYRRAAGMLIPRMLALPSAGFTPRVEEEQRQGRNDAQHRSRFRNRGHHVNRARVGGGAEQRSVRDVGHEQRIGRR